MINGIINIYKEPGYTSFDVVAKLRGILKQKKIGHTGTLDPMATGVLVVCLGQATKLVDLLTQGTKQYKATMKLGLSTDTEDITGKVLQTEKVDVSVFDIEKTIKEFVGKYSQIPPMYSAIKKDGKKLYEYARNGIDVEREARPVEIFSIENISFDLPYVSFDVHCSKGTYIRSLCRDIGEKLGCHATLAALERKEVHGFMLEDAYKLDEISRMASNGTIMDAVLPIDAILGQYSKAIIKPDKLKYLQNGNKLSDYNFIFDSVDKTPIIRVYNEKEIMALYEYTDEGVYKPYKMFVN